MDDPIRSDLRALAIRGLLPLGAATMQGALRSRLATRWLEGSRREARGSASGAHSSRRVERQLAEEIENFAEGTTEFPAVRPLIDRPIGDARLRIRPYAWFEGRWNGGRAAVWGDHPRVGLAGTLHLSPSLSLSQDLFAGHVEDGRQFGDALVNHTDFLLFVESVDATWAQKSGFLRLGRFRHGWGPGRSGNLLIAPTAQPFDQLEYGLEFGPFRFRSTTGTIDPAAEKNVALHRLEWSPHPRWLLAVSEGAVFRGSPLQPVYLLGLVPYSVVDRLRGQDVFRSGDLADVRNNVLVQADILVRVREDTALWGEMLVDDVGTESADHPSRFGFVLGAETEISRGGWEWNFGAEAVKIYDFVYSVYYEDSDWSHQERPLGFPIGPDSELLSVIARCRPALAWEVGVELDLQRIGEGRSGRPWYPSADPRSEGNPDSPPAELSGTVERRTSGAASLTWAPSAALRAQVRATLTEIGNAGNLAGVDRDDHRVDLSVHWRR